MSQPHEYSFIRYLTSKKSVDDRALNAEVWQRLQNILQKTPSGFERRPFSILEIGAGVGTMLERLLNTNLPSCHYTALDASLENINVAQERLFAWNQRDDWTVRQIGQQQHDSNVETLLFQHDRRERTVQVNLVAVDLFDFLGRPEISGSYDLLIAHAFLDLVDLSRTLPALARLLNPGGYGYFSINFDGATILQPTIEPKLDVLIEKLYHETMDKRIVNGFPSGDSQTGRHLFAALPQAGFRVLEAGSSDWVVFPYHNGYREDEAYFLHFIVKTMQGALAAHPYLQYKPFEEWIAQRHRQIEEAELIYIAHQLDFLVTIK
ncbi:class I SAM-dependent methyltransferase [Chloroflexi bacterium TSY]|nr:class I SAM-dependent methyltransferase [Chloroflexi bacterium TSY]